MQPGGKPRLIESGIVVDSIRTGVVQSLNATAGAIALVDPAHPVPQIYSLAPGLSVRGIKVGQAVRVRVTEELTVFVAGVGGAVPEAEHLPSAADVRVLSVDRSYRLLTLLRTDGRRETLKVSPRVKLSEMQPGDDVAIQSMQVIAVQPGQ